MRLGGGATKGFLTKVGGGADDLNGWIGAAAGWLKAAMRSRKAFDLAATGGGAFFADAAALEASAGDCVSSGDLMLLCAERGEVGDRTDDGSGLEAVAGTCSGGG